MEVCQKALDRIEKIRTAERNLKECKRYHICPKCGEDMEKRRVNLPDDNELSKNLKEEPNGQIIP
jgi:hypothetical protein